MFQAANMIFYRLKVLLYVLISVGLLVPLDADDDGCTTQMKVWRNTVYKASPGQELRIACPVVFCRNLPPAVSWYKVEETRILVSVNDNRHIKIGWEMERPLRGVSYLIFQNILRSDSGGYRCESGIDVSHMINVIVNDDTQPTTTASFQLWTSPTSGNNSQYMCGHYSYRLVGIGAFLVIVISISVTSQIVLKGRSRKAADSCSQSSDQNYENV